VRLLGGWSKERLPILPKLPSVSEQGWPEFEAGTFITITAPRGTPADVVEKLNVAFVKAVNAPKVKAKIIEMGFTPVANSPAATAAFLHREEVKWAKVIDDLGLKARN
jgi:tripartite-type tricarboxylate transporter receptor subunit TctC